MISNVVTEISLLKRVYGQFSIETIHERRKWNREFSGFFFSVLLIRIGKHNVNESAPGAKLGHGNGNRA